MKRGGSPSAKSPDRPIRAGLDPLVTAGRAELLAQLVAPRIASPDVRLGALLQLRDDVEQNYEQYPPLQGPCVFSFKVFTLWPGMTYP